jgi:hypothetical protein
MGLKWYFSFFFLLAHVLNTRGVQDELEFVAIYIVNLGACMNILFIMKVTRKYSCSLHGHIGPLPIMSTMKSGMVIVLWARNLGLRHL